MPAVQRPTDPAAWARFEAICSALPDVTSKPSHGELAWFVGPGSRPKQFASTWDHHHDDRNGVVMAAAAGVQELVVAEDPARYFRPPYVGAKGWIGMYVDIPDVDWDLIEVRLQEAHAAIAG